MNIMNEVFNIPLLLDLITYDFDQIDLLHCALVNRAWQAFFQPIWWRSVAYPEPHNSEAYENRGSALGTRVPVLTEEQKGVLFRHVGWMERLDISLGLKDYDVAAEDLFLSLGALLSGKGLGSGGGGGDDDATAAAGGSGTGPTRLRHLGIRLPSPPIQLDQYQVLLDTIGIFLCYNPGLQSLTLNNLHLSAAPAKQNLFDQLLTAIAGHRRLQTLNVFSTGKIKAEMMVCWLKSLPLTLVDLEMEGSLQGKTSKQGSIAETAWRALPKLERLKLGENWKGYEESVLIPFLNGTHPNSLVRFELPAVGVLKNWAGLVLAVECPNLKELTVEYGTVQQGELIPLVEHLHGLQVLEMDTKVDLSDPSDPSKALSMTIPRLIHHSGSSLHTIKLDREVSIHSASIQLLLTNCPSLVIFWVLTYPTSDDMDSDDFSRSTLSLKDLTSSSSWICLHLQDLELTILDTTPTETTITRLYQQLGQLTQLKNLGLGWRTTSSPAPITTTAAAGAPPCPTLFDFSLTSGLKILQPLQNLSRLDLGECMWIKMGLLEIQWIVKHWPKLCSVKGLGNRRGDGWRREQDEEDENREGMEREEEEHLALLKHLMPWIEIDD